MITHRPVRATHRRLTALLLASVAVLVGCATIPLSGPVMEGDADVLPVEPLQPIQEGPSPSDDPARIVTGFLSASAGGVATDFAVAREFLTPEAAATWDPRAQTLVYSSGAVNPELDEQAGTVSYEFPLASLIDDSGRRTDSTDGTVADVVFTVEQDADGLWRISELADGVVLSQANFTRFFRAVDLVFASADRTTIVPELRWLPDTNVVTSAARELVQGPSPWLADAVHSGFPATAALAVESVVVADGIATVDVTPQSAGTPEDRALAAEQMRATLTTLPGVIDVDVQIGGLPMVQGDRVSLNAAPVPDAEALVVASGRLGTWDGEALLVTDDAVGGVGNQARGFAMSYDRQRVAYIDGDDLMITSVLAEAADNLVELSEEPSELTEPIAATVAVTAPGLVAPSFDRLGYLWTVGATAEDGLISVSPDGEVLAFPSEWLRARSTVGLSVSRDGAFVAVLSRSGGQPVLEVASIHRGPDGSPLGLGNPVTIGVGVGAGIDVVWADDSTVAVLGEPREGSSSPLWLVTVGGGTSTLATQLDAGAIAVRAGEASLVVVSSEGRVDERSGSAWATVLDGISELTYSG